LAIVPVTAGGVGRYEFFELDLQCDLAAANPFDPEELEIRVQFMSPAGMKTEIGAFWYQILSRLDIVPLAIPVGGFVSPLRMRFFSINSRFCSPASFPRWFTPTQLTSASGSSHQSPQMISTSWLSLMPGALVKGSLSGAFT
jgi:hypothetical protein